MATLEEYFRTEARDSLAAMEAALEGETPDSDAVYRAARTLRGTAQLARQDHVFRAASALEAAAKALLGGELAWDTEQRAAVQGSIEDLRALIFGAEGDEQQEAIVADVEQRWSDAAPAVQPVETTERPSAERDDAFLAFVAQEVAGIGEVLDRGIQQLGGAPMDRDPLRSVLRRQRALLGAARLDEVPVVAEVLRAIEDLTRVIARLDVGVKQEWLDVYRVARDALRQALEALQQGSLPQSTNAASRLRHMRAELLERFGKPDAPPPVNQATGLVHAQPYAAAPDPFAPQPAAPAPAPEPAEDAVAVLELESDQIVDEPDPRPVVDDAPDLLGAASSALVRAAAGGVAPAGAAELESAEVVPVEDLCYSAEDALRHALAFEDVLRRATAHDAEARAAADELFDLIRYALG